MINDDEDDDGMYDGASGLKVFILYVIVIPWVVLLCVEIIHKL